MNDTVFDINLAAGGLAQAGLLVAVHAPANGRLQVLAADAGLTAAAGSFCGASLDSRTLADGQLFVAMQGEKIDGRRFIPAALERGHWVLAEAGPDGTESYAAAAAPAGTGVLVTADPAAALACLAADWRSRRDVQVVGVTGTNGKTTTKDLLAAMLSGAGPTLATAGNYNNRLGVPLTLLGLQPEHRYAVIEMGASAVGDIARLAPLAAPRTGIITNAAPAHLAEFNSLAEIIRGKGELLDSLPRDGCAVLNADSPGFGEWSARVRCPVVSFGRERGDQRWTWQPGDATAPGRVTVAGTVWDVPLPGEHNGANLVAALLAARSLGVADERIRAGLAGFAGSVHRGVMLRIAGRTVLDDSYNANPGSVLAACRTLAQLPGDGLTVAVLGHMAELGPDSETIHENTGRELAAGDLDILLAVGEKARPLSEGFDAAAGEGHYCATLAEAAAWLADRTGDGDRLLIKGSRSAGMEGILPILAKAFSGN
jgi:UDP-N-acetylmuramoyl-tripeptide--D-alanyl-D-alanine ligase